MTQTDSKVNAHTDHSLCIPHVPQDSFSHGASQVNPIARRMPKLHRVLAF